MKPNKMQQHADVYLLLNYSTYFGRPSRPSSGVHKTVFAVTGADHTIGEGCFPDSVIHDGKPRNRSSIPRRAKTYSLFEDVKTDSAAYIFSSLLRT
jgi:hypothetical protein